MKNLRVSKLFELFKLQKEKNCEIIITTGVENEKKRIKEIIDNESSLMKLSVRFLPVGLDAGFCYARPIPKNSSRVFSMIRKKESYLPLVANYWAEKKS